MEAKTNVQICSEKARAVYQAQGQPPLLAQIAAVHNLSYRDLASIFGVSKSLIEMIFRQERFPSLELGVRIARYFEVTVEELFGWRIDDDGKRRPLLIEDPETHQVRILNHEDRVGAIELAMEKTGEK